MTKIAQETEEIDDKIGRLKCIISMDINKEVNEINLAKRIQTTNDSIKTEKARQGFLKHCQKAIHCADNKNKNKRSRDNCNNNNNKKLELN